MARKAATGWQAHILTMFAISPGPGFQDLHKSQMEKHYQEFTPDYENPIDFEIFKEYSQTIGLYIENELKKALPEFNMEAFVYALQ